VSSLRPGDVIRGKFLIESEIGSGGMGTVYQAIHVRMKARVAIKVLDKDRAASRVNVSRFEREALAAARLRGSYTVRVYDADVLDSGVPFLVMELLRGRELSQLLRQSVPSTDKAVDWTIQICSAMHEAHQLGIVHRDLKPSNIFVLDGDDRIKIVDFGISKLRDGAELTADSEVLGTPKYMSPEQLRGDKVGPQSDLWSLGLILYRLLASVHPFPTPEGGAPFVAAVAMLTQEPVPIRAYRPDLPAPLLDAVMCCLEKDLAKRIGSARELAAKLAPYGSGSVAFEEIAADAYEREPMPSLSAFSVDSPDGIPAVNVSLREPLVSPTSSTEGTEPTLDERSPTPFSAASLPGATETAPRSGAVAWRAASLLAVLVALGAGLAVWAWPESSTGQTAASGSASPIVPEASRESPIPVPTPELDANVASAPGSSPTPATASPRKVGPKTTAPSGARTATPKKDDLPLFLE